jgi:tetratricopeptide (TPR) repeat protein
MKSAKRHELEKNELADWLGEQIEAVKPHLLTLVAAAIFVVALILLGVYYFTGRDSGTAAKWAQYFGAFSEPTPEPALQEVIKSDPTAVPSLWAEQTLGDLNLERASMELFRDRDEAKKLLAAAEEAYKKVNSSAQDPQLLSRARIGLGKVYEAQGNAEQARKFYEMAAEIQKGSALGTIAERGVERMSNPRDAGLVAWFAKQKPKKPAPMPGMPGSSPALPDLPDRPDLSLPSSLDLNGAAPPPGGDNAAFPPPADTKKPDESPKTDAAKTEPPKTETTPPADEKPSASKSAESKPDDAKAPAPANEDKADAKAEKADKKADAKPAEDKPSDKPPE